MRILSAIFPFYIFLLVASPAFDNLFSNSQTDCCKEICSDVEGESQDKGSGRNGECDDCNLFSMCSCYPGFIPVVNTFLLHNSEKHFYKYPLYRQSFTSEVFSSFWQPPKLIS